MSQDDSCCRICSRGFYSCYWVKPSQNMRKHACCWFSVVALVSVLSLCWMYICLVTFNDQDEVNWKGFTELQRWVNWFMVLIIISAVLTSYCVLLLIFALIQVALREPLDLHLLHKVFLFFGVIFIAMGITGITLQWHKEWPIIPLSLMITGPFLQLGAVGALTLLSPFIFRGIHMASCKCSKYLVVVVFLVVSTVIFLSPPYIQSQSPCLIYPNELPEKPKLIGHRGAPMVAPENTMMSFERSITWCNVTAFETDIQLSKDRIPFLMHDSGSQFLSRTTNVKEKFPGKNLTDSRNITWEELQSLNAGEWFVKTDPFRSVSSLSEAEIETARKQTIPSLLELLELAKQHNISVLFDLKSSDEENDTEVIVKIIRESGIDHNLILWLPPQKRQYVKKNAPDFIQVYSDVKKCESEEGKYLNMKYSEKSPNDIRKLRSNNTIVNMWVVNERWLFSLLWCAGASSVTTNSCHLLKDMDKPDLTMTPRKYKVIWITVDVVSIVIMTALFLWKTYYFCDRQDAVVQRNNMPALNERERFPFLANV